METSDTALMTESPERYCLQRPRMRTSGSTTSEPQAYPKGANAALWRRNANNQLLALLQRPVQYLRAVFINDTEPHVNRGCRAITTDDPHLSSTPYGRAGRRRIVLSVPSAAAWP